jgi:hypothetical protein
MITMADGSLKAIENVHKGDKVKSWKKNGMIDESVPGWYDWETDKVDDGEHEDSTVMHAKVNTYMHYHILKLSNGKDMKVTWEHPLLVKQDNKWSFKQVRKIKVNDKLKAEDGSEVNIDSNEMVWAPIVTFNLDVEETDTYYADGILAHNVDHTKQEEQLQEVASNNGITIPEGQTASFFFGGSFGNPSDSKMIF